MAAKEHRSRQRSGLTPMRHTPSKLGMRCGGNLGSLKGGRTSSSAHGRAQAALVPDTCPMPPGDARARRSWRCGEGLHRQSLTGYFGGTTEIMKEIIGRGLGV